MSKIITDKEKIDELLTRSIDTIYPSREAFEEVLLSGKQLNIYLGIDPTADYIHIGHATNLLLLERFHNLGHKITLLVGDFTAMIGDPSDKKSERVKLSKEQVLKNLKTYKKQVGAILNFKDKKNPIAFKFNSKWLSKLDFSEIAELASNFTVQQILERDLFKKRINSGKPLHLQEFLYPLLQGYDSVALKTDVEIGGTDQTFNMLAGRTLVRRYQNREKFVITTTLLVNTKTGEKLMSKSLGTGVGLNESPGNMFGKVMALPDEGIIQTFTDCTRLPMSEIDDIIKKLSGGTNPRDLKMRLALEITSIYHGKKKAELAKDNFIQTFQKNKIPTDIKNISVSKENPLIEVFIKNRIVSSKNEFRRLVDGGAISNLSTKEKVLKYTDKVQNGVYRIGKKRFIKITIKK